MADPRTNPDQVANPGRRRNALAGVPPNVREKLAQWIEDKVREFPRLIAQSKAYQRTHPEDQSERGQCAYYTNALAFARFLAYWLRTERVTNATEGQGTQAEDEGATGAAQ